MYNLLGHFKVKRDCGQSCGDQTLFFVVWVGRRGGGGWVREMWWWRRRGEKRLETQQSKKRRTSN